MTGLTTSRTAQHFFLVLGTFLQQNQDVSKPQTQNNIRKTELVHNMNQERHQQHTDQRQKERFGCDIQIEAS